MKRIIKTLKDLQNSSTTLSHELNGVCLDKVMYTQSKFLFGPNQNDHFTPLFMIIWNKKNTFLQSKNDESFSFLFSSNDSLIDSSCSVRLQI